jgi:S1-C subfamily serine protease
MPDPHATRGLAGTAPKLAIGAAVVALVMSSLAVIVVVSRAGGGTAVAPIAPAGAGSGVPGVAPGSAKADDRAGAPALPPARRVAATDVVRLRREAVVLVRDASRTTGVRVTDEDLRKALDLGPDDVITAIAGRAIEREFDVLEAIFAVKSLRASTIHVDLLRDGHPVLARWTVDGDLRTARAPSPYDPGSYGGGAGPADPSGIFGVLGGSSGSSAGGTGGSLGPNPFLPATPDPLADTIKRIDDLHYEVPRATLDRVLAARSSYTALARALPSRRTPGVQLFGIRPGSLLAAVGILNGDVLRAINANAVTTADEVLDLLPQIQGDRVWRVDLYRRGKPVLITLTIK